MPGTSGTVWITGGSSRACAGGDTAPRAQMAANAASGTCARPLETTRAIRPTASITAAP